MSRNRSLDKLVARIRGLELEVRGQRTPSLAYSSIEGGAITSYSTDGTQMMIIGQQADGTNTAAVVSGPPPPMPIGLSVVPTVAGLLGAWDGTFLDGAIAPMDFARVEFHISSSGPDFIPDLVGENSATMFGTCESPRGGPSLAGPLPYVEHWVKIVARSQSGKFGDSSPAVAGTPVKIANIDLDDLAVTTQKIAQYAITSDKVDDFALGVTKFQTLTHQIY